MRRYQQKQILDVLKTLGDAQKAGLYADCQDGVISIGEYIEEIEGEGTQTVTLLEEYCELLYKASNGEVGMKALDKCLLRIENSVKNDLKPTRIEMVFLSYKASMSDSIESIYMAAKEDPNCDVYWIPIPYYNRNPDGTLGTMHCEGQDYYKPSIECTDWQDYNIEERNPDVIFTFAPYDDLGHVTTVHPDFYCKRLRELTYMLVYVPYFVTSEAIGPPFTKCAGIMFSHLSIVQSEPIRQCYIRGYKELEKIGYSREIYGVPEDKILALGSPKFDAVINAKPTDFTLPDEWLSIINNPDGTKKKVVLYNTSVTALLNNTEQYLEKLKAVLDSFVERNDIVLWWRPHPLSSTSIASVCPELSHEYEQIVTNYSRAGFGIYDDTPDLHRAIACTDGYYGDWSSLVFMYIVTGKPVVMQDINTIDNEVLLRFADFTQDDEGIYWGFEQFSDGLFRLDFDNDSAYCVIKSSFAPQYLGKKYLFSTHRYTKICCIGSKVICFPFFLDNILVYDSETGSTEIVPLDRDYLLSPDSDGFAFRYIVEYDGNVHCFSNCIRAVVVFNASNYSVRYDTTLYNKIGLWANMGQLTKQPLYISECSDDGSITLLMRRCESLIRYNLFSQEIEIIATNPMLVQCVSAVFDGEDYWLITEDFTELIKWNPVSDNTTKYYLSTDGFILPNVASIITGIIDCGEYLLIFPGYATYILKFDKQSERFSEYKEMSVPVDEENILYKYDKPKRISDKVYAFARHNYTMYELDTSSSRITQHRFCLDKNSAETFYSGFFENINNNEYADSISCDIIYDHGIGDIACFLAGALQKVSEDDHEIRDNLPQIYGSPNGMAGKAIFDYIIEVLG